VTYAPPGRDAELAATAGNGAVAIFNESGVLQKVLINGSELAAPWGIALAPASFGEFANALLVGNFSAVESEIKSRSGKLGFRLSELPGSGVGA